MKVHLELGKKKQSRDHTKEAVLRYSSRLALRTPERSEWETDGDESKREEMPPRLPDSHISVPSKTINNIDGISSGMPMESMRNEESVDYINVTEANYFFKMKSSRRLS